MKGDKNIIAYTCCYAPVQVIDAGGFTPFRILPMGGSPDQAGGMLHENLCPHVKRILDRGLSGDIPPLDGVLFMNSCDAMRRLADAWKRSRPGDRMILCDLPACMDGTGISFFREELARAAHEISRWSGRTITHEDIYASIERYNHLAGLLGEAESMALNSRLPGGAPGLQDIYTMAMTGPLDETVRHLRVLVKGDKEPGEKKHQVPVLIFGNVLPDPEMIRFVESCGARVVSNDLCTGSRMFTVIDNPRDLDPFLSLARGLLSKAPCARTLDTERPFMLGEYIVQRARDSGARGVIGHTMKFCDPYILRLPMVREMLQRSGYPVLLLEGDCTMRSLGQQRTRIEAFIEMLR